MASPAPRKRYRRVNGTRGATGSIVRPSDYSWLGGRIRGPPAIKSGQYRPHLAEFRRLKRRAIVIRHWIEKAGWLPGMGLREAANIEAELTPPFTVQQPRHLTGPFVFNSPHSGRVYPKTFLEASRLDALTLRKSEDVFVEELFVPVVGLGAPLMHAHFPRAYLDVNREPYELDPALIADSLPRYANTQSVRVVGGLGTIARVVTESEEIYREPLSLAQALVRINRLYKPYHAALQDLMEQCSKAFGLSVLIDCHSMPSNPTSDLGGPRPDFVLGDRFGTSCDPELTRFVAQRLKSMGYVVTLNKPYAGGFITEHYGRPVDGLHALQIEVNRALYLNEETFEKRAGFDALQADLERLARAMFAIAPVLLNVPRAAAE